ncbi:unnamed protein product [Heterobilharzia americana]|nr:unnamed protein product [Heterobilharzia americana]
MVECVSPSSVCVFSFLFQMSMYRGLVVEEPSFLCLDADGNFFSIDCTQTLISGDDCKGIIDWFVSPLCTVVAQQSNEHRKCCGCSVEFQVSNWVALFCLPHIRPLPLERISEMLFQAIPILMNSLPDFNKSDTDIQLLDDDDEECILHLLAVSEAIYKIRSTTNQNLYNGKVFPHQMTFNKLIRIAAELSNGDSGFCCIILRVIDILVHVFILDCFFDDDHVFLHEYLQSIQRYLVPLLSCYSHQIRLHILRILSVIYGKLKNLEDNVCDNTQGVTTSYHSSPVYNVIERCLKAERIKLGPQTARDFLMHILQLHADHDVKSCSQAAEIALRYLFGLLHVQFTAIWPSVYEAISSYCEGITYTHKQKSASIISSVSGDDSVDTVTNQLTTDAKNWSIECKNLFWSLFKPLLLDVETKIVSNVDTVKDLQQKSSNSTLENIYSCSYETAIIWFTSIRPDLHSLLRKTTRNDRLSIEPRKPPDWIAYRLCLWQCLRWKGASKNTRFLTPLLLNTISSALQFGVNKSSEQLLLIILDLYSQFTNIKSIYMEKEFKEAIHHLLKFKQPTIQKAAFKCLLAYKQPSINNYQEQIEQIIDLQTFRDTVRTFRLDTSLFSSEHREQISGVLLRILYGRLQLSKGQFASAIFTNLALCTDSELNLFLSFLLDPLIKESEAMSTINFTDNKLNESIQCIRQRVENTIYGKDSLSWPRLHALSKLSIKP